MCRCYCDAVSQCNTPSRSCKSTVVVNSTHSMSKLSVITVCLPVIFELSGPRNLLKTVCAIDRLRKHCYHSVSFPVVVWCPWVTCLALHNHLRIHVRCSALSPKVILKPLFIFWSFSVKRKVLVYCLCKYFKSFTDRWHALQSSSPTISFFSLQ